MSITPAFPRTYALIQTPQRGSLPEFEHPDCKTELGPGRLPADPLPHVIRYIEAQANEQFKVSITVELPPGFLERDGSIACVLKIDGRRVEARIANVPRYYSSPERVFECQFEDVITGNAKEGYKSQTFRFTSLCLGEFIQVRFNY